MRSLPSLPALLSLPMALPMALLLVGCTSQDGGDVASGDARTVTVSSTADACDLSTTTVPAGKVTFSITNDGSDVTEFYLYSSDGSTVVSELENIGPGITRDLVLDATAGTYQATCKPGMTGDGIRQKFTVTPSDDQASLPRDHQRKLDEAVVAYERFVQRESASLLAATQQFASAVKAGDDARARRLYPEARTHFERIEPVAESFGSLDPKLDLREADLADGQRWTGWHALEKDLWPPRSGYRALSDDERDALAEQLVRDTRSLHSLVADLQLRPDQIGNGAKSLLDEVATGKVTGEEEIWSHTDLVDFAANIEGAREAFTVLTPALREAQPGLVPTLEERFTAVERMLAQHRTADGGYEPYTALSQAEVKRLADAVNALSEPLAQLTAAVVSA